jgi:hypothetical protein
MRDRERFCNVAKAGRREEEKAGHADRRAFRPLDALALAAFAPMPSRIPCECGMRRQHPLGATTVPGAPGTRVADDASSWIRCFCAQGPLPDKISRDSLRSSQRASLRMTGVKCGGAIRRRCARCGCCLHLCGRAALGRPCRFGRARLSRRWCRRRSTGIRR